MSASQHTPKRKLVFMLSYGDGGDLGIYSTASKAVDAARKSFEERGLTASGSQLAMARTELKETHHSARLIALEAVDQYDESKVLKIQGWALL